ncbi:hypothetical protein JHK87_036115 [Glycine soja]|nr:hypothetical protein JHK87_036115 [Glycine soja]
MKKTNRNNSPSFKAESSIRLGIGNLHHGSPGLCVEGQLLLLECRRIEDLVVILAVADNFHLEPTAVGIRREGTKGAEKGGVGELGVEHKWM